MYSINKTEIRTVFIMVHLDFPKHTARGTKISPI